MNTAFSHRGRQSGAALVVSLIFLLLMTLLTVLPAPLPTDVLLRGLPSPVPTQT